MNLWVVDDCPSWPAIISALAPAGVHVVHIKSVLEMLGRLQAEQPSAALVDLHFRCDAASGHDAAASLRIRGIPHIVCTDGEPEIGPPGTMRKWDIQNNLPDALRWLGLEVTA